MRPLDFQLTVVRAIAIAILSLPRLSVSADDLTFNRDVLPILSNQCFTCHGPDASTREGGFRLDQRDSATRAADSGETPIMPGDADASELIWRITSDDPDQRMPPEGSNATMTQDQIAVLRAWIDGGAEYQAHWAFVPPQPSPVPDVEDPTWPNNDIDRFVLKRLEGDGRRPAREASRETLIRRVAFDLTGLPPRLDEIDMFLADQSQRAYERMVDRYLDSSAYGEHMTRHWLDLARYADSNGYQYDTEREQWVWRDWLIDAYNSNKPFDQFTIEQLAGDLLPNATPEQRLATGFNRNHSITIEGGIIDEEYRTEYVMDRLVTTGEVWMGLTVGCARCHDHKYDPISQREFYELYAFFNQVPERGMKGFDPKERIASPLGNPKLDELNAQLTSLREEMKSEPSLDERQEAWLKQISMETTGGWQVLSPRSMTSTGGSLFTRQDDDSLVVGGANPAKDIYEITAQSNELHLTAVRLQALTDQSLPGGGPGRHSNSNFVLSEIELTAVSLKDLSVTQQIKFTRAEADYSQKGYEIDKAIDGSVAGNNGWAVDGPERKQAATAVFIADAPFGFEGGTQLRFRLRHEAGFATHGIGRPRLSVTSDAPETLEMYGIPADIRSIVARPRSQRTDNESARLREYFEKQIDRGNATQDRIKAIEKQIANFFPETMVMKEMPQPRATHLLVRGQYDAPGEPVAAGVPGIFPALSDDASVNRLDFANWLVGRSHPLTARVAVNRYWQRVFGVGLVKTSEDFGVQGELPSHPELLDWLALRFIDSGWDIKQIQRLILNSATYRQSSQVGREAYERDPENRLLARGPRLRLDGEQIRDSALAVSGLLVDQMGGRSVYPYQPKGLWMELNNRPGYSKEYPQGNGEDLYRRSMYTFWKRTVPSPMMRTLDAPEREFCTLRRSRTNTPLQTLLLLNGPQFVEAARHLGERMMIEGGAEVDSRIRYGFRLVTSRTPSAEEVQLLRRALDAEIIRFADDDVAALGLLQVGDSPVNTDLDASELAAYTELARLLLNLSEAITKG